MENCIEVDLKYCEGNFTEAQYFILNGNITECHCNINRWSDPIEFDCEETDRQLLKHIVDCFKNGADFAGFGKIEFIKIWNRSNFKNF